MENCAFTGHRPERFVFKYNEAHEHCRDIKKAILTACRWYINKGVKIFYAGGALGVDMWGAEIVLWLRDKKGEDVKLICALPCKGYNDKWSAEQKRRMETILREADEVIYVSESYSAQVFEKRNYFMVDRAENVIAVYDHTTKKRSGTMQTVNYALKMNRHILGVHPDTAKVAEKIDAKGEPA